VLLVERTPPLRKHGVSDGVASALDAGRFRLAGKRCALSSMTATMTPKAGRLLMITSCRMALTPRAIAFTCPELRIPNTEL
jgi:hypothetical protein